MIQLPSNFSPYEAQLVLSIPLSWYGREDGWTWVFAKSGEYTVRSGHHVAVAIRWGDQHPSSSVSGFRGVKIWALMLPEKVKLLVWCAYKDILPVKANLLKKRVSTDGCCPICGQENETIIHVLKDCSFARAIWMGCSLSLRASEIQVDSFTEFFEEAAKQLDASGLEFFSVVCWLLWANRNEVLWNNNRRTPVQVIEQATSYICEYRRVVLRLKEDRRGRQCKRDVKWKPPDLGCYKMNVDGALFAQNQSYGMGAVIRDGAGEVKAAMACKGYGLVSPEIVEAYSLRRALLWARDGGFNEILVECDSACVVSGVISSAISSNTELGAVFKDCQQLMSQFQQCKLQHVMREGNRVAHELAQRAGHVEADEFWANQLPEHIKRVAEADIVHMS